MRRFARCKMRRPLTSAGRLNNAMLPAGHIAKGNFTRQTTDSSRYHFFMQRPALTEIAPYFHGYLSLVPAGRLALILTGQGEATKAQLEKLTPKQADHRYAADKWSVRQLVGHLIDTERILCYRALCIARGETTALPGFDENAYVANGNFDRRSMSDLAAELGSVRAASVSLILGIDPAATANIGTANEKPMSVRAICWVIAGHELHHRNILRDRYGIG